MSGAVTARHLTRADFDEWNRLVAASPEGSVYSTPEYLGTLC